MATATTGTRKKFVIQIIKPSHYDDDGYVIQWLRAFIPPIAGLPYRCAGRQRAEGDWERRGNRRRCLR